MRFLFYAFLCFVLLAEPGGRYGETPNAFIFSLNNFERLAPFVSKVKLQHKGKAIDRHSFYGPKFGPDLVISLDANSETDLGRYYSVPAVVQHRSIVLAGTKNFASDEVEVFYLDLSR